MNDFLNPKSMLTPGVAGALMMFLVNGLAFQFPELSLRYLALFMSFLIGSVVWFSDLKGRAPMVQKCVYWVLNSLVIFVVGFGTSNLAADVTSETPPGQPSHTMQLLAPTSAFAEPTEPATATGTATSEAQLRAMSERLVQEREENERLKRELEASRRRTPPPPPKPAPRPASKPQQQFFKRW